MSNPSADAVGRAYIDQARRKITACQDRIVHCLNQLNDAQIWWRPLDSMNSVANLLLHLCGNVRQWIINGVTGTHQSRNRPQEFAERGPLPREDLLKLLSSTVNEADRVLSGIASAQLLEPRRIQGFDETVLSAIFDSVAHFQGHTQEIVSLTRMQLGAAYRFAWTPQTREQGAPTRQ